MGQGDATGGSLELARLIDRHGEVLLPELKHYFGIDLRDLFSEVTPWSPRYIIAHVKWLPIGSAFVAETRGGQVFRGWDPDRYMKVATIEAIRALHYVFVLANSDPKKAKPKPPDPYPVPDKVVRQKAPPKPGSFAFIVAARLTAAKEKRKAAARG